MLKNTMLAGNYSAKGSCTFVQYLILLLMILVVGPKIKAYVAEPKLSKILIAEKEIAKPKLVVPIENVIKSYQGNLIPETVNDGNYYNGWTYKLNGKWIPGMPSFASQFLLAPDVFTGSAYPYGPNVMEGTAKYNELSLDGVVDGVALMTCANHGGLVWLKRPKNDWEGPFKVIDCAARQDLYNVAVHNGEAVEVGFKTALKWGMASKPVKLGDGTWSWDWINRRIDNVIVSTIPPEQLPQNYEVIDYSEWFREQVTFDSFKTNVEATTYYNSVPRMLYRPPSKKGGLPYWRIPPSKEFVQFDLNTPKKILGTSADAIDFSKDKLTPSKGKLIINSKVLVWTPTLVKKSFTVKLDEIWIEIDLSKQILYVYKGNDNVKEFSISSGLPKTPTPTGSYKIYAMYTDYTMLGQNGNIPHVPWSIFFHGEYAIHGADWHDNFGTPMSRGCINMRVEDAAWLYSRVQKGTHVYIHT